MFSFKPGNQTSMICARLLRLVICAALLLWAEKTLEAAALEVLDVPGIILQDNPLGDPAARRVAAFLPDGIKADTPLPLVVYLPGWGGSSEDAIAQGNHGWFGRVVDALAAEGVPLRLAVVDCRARYGGCQFLNSSATGNYADYVCNEVVPLLKARYRVGKEHPAERLIAGHSSGGYGALMLAMMKKEEFGGVVALSPDSDFETTHKALVEQASVRDIRPADLDAAIAPRERMHLPEDGLARLVMGLCANYAPCATADGRFEWLYDSRGHWRPEAWQRWIDRDPLNAVRRQKDAFSPTQRIYLDGAEQDEFGANIGARKIREVLATRESPVTFYEAPGHHAEHLPERLVRGLSWIFGRPVKDIVPAN